jgi:hypothetical protein
MLMPAHPTVTRHDHYAVPLRLPETLTAAGVGVSCPAFSGQGICG